jgi:hypothetical protein
MSYNGWTNKETWLVNVWFEDSLAETLQESGIRDAYDAAEYLQEYIGEYCIDGNVIGGFVQDIFNCAFHSVNWHELAESYLADIALEENKES